MSQAFIKIEADQNSSTVKIIREDGVRDDQWLAVRSEFSSDGRDAARSVSVSVAVFMAHVENLVRRCRALGVDATLDDNVRELAKTAATTRADLREAQDDTSPIAPPELSDLLAGTRFTRDLREFQIRDSGRLLKLANGANFSVPGAGKTAVALAVYEAERMRGRVKRMLVVGPLSAFGSWFDEVKDSFSPKPLVSRFDGSAVPSSVEILMVNYQRLASNLVRLAVWVSAEPTLVLLDEAHRMKRGWSGEWGSSCLSLAYLATRRDILTGTPAPQSPRDFVALLDFLWPNSAFKILPGAVTQARPPDDIGARVANAIGPLFARTTKADLGLPPVTYRPVTVKLSPLHRDVYDALRDSYGGKLSMSRRERVDFIAMGRIVMYLLEAATNPALLTAGSLDGSDPDIFGHPPLEVPPDSHLADLLRDFNQYDTPRKFVELGTIIRENAELGRKTLIWTNFVRNLRILEKMLALYEPAVIHGGVSPFSTNPDDRTRETEIGRFRNDADCAVLIANPAAMSEGISLHKDCHDAVYLDRTFNAGQYLQSLDRIHRLGLGPTEETRVTFLLAEDTVDDIVDVRVRDKARRLGEMLDDPNLVSVALPDDEDYGPVIDTFEDAVALFAHLRGEPVGQSVDS